MDPNSQLVKQKGNRIKNWFIYLWEKYIKRHSSPILWDKDTDDSINAEFTNYEEREEAKELLRELLRRNAGLLETLDIRLLNKKYVDLFGKAKLERIITDKPLQERIADLSSEELQTYSYILNYDVVDFKERIANLSTHCAGIDLEKFKSLSEPDKIKVISILTSNSEFYLLNLDELNDYYEKRKSRCKEIIDNPQIVEEEYKKDIESDDEEDISIYPFGLLNGMMKLSHLDRVKYAIIEAKFGMSLEKAQILCGAFGDNIDNIEQSEETRVIKELKDILGEEDIEKLRQISLDENEANYKGTINLISNLRNAYLHKYQESLYQIKEEDYIGTQSVKTKGKNTDVKIYNVLGKNNDRAEFNMILTSLIGIYLREHDYDDLAADWDRASANHTIPCSLIGNDFLGVVCDEYLLAFADIEDNELLRVSNEDAGTVDTPFEMFEELYENTFLTLQNLKNTTKNYNELLVERKIEKDGKLVNRKPTYAVFIAESIEDINDESNERWTETKRLAAELGIPIAVIDGSQCINLEYAKVQEMVRQVKEEKKMKLIPDIIHKIENNRAAQMGVLVNVRNRVFSNKNVSELLENIIGSIITSDTDSFYKGIEEFEKVTKEVKSVYNRKLITNKEKFQTYDYDAYLERMRILRSTRKPSGGDNPQIVKQETVDRTEGTGIVEEEK